FYTLSLPDALPILSVSISATIGRDLLQQCVVADPIELLGQVAATRASDLTVDQDVHLVRADRVQEAVVMRDDQDPHLGVLEAVDAVRDDLDRVDVEARIGLV